MTDLSPLLRIRDAHVRRAGREILAVDEFSLAEGESAALLGPNGSGKSTFIGLITREIHPLHRDEAPCFFGAMRASPWPTSSERWAWCRPRCRIRFACMCRPRISWPAACSARWGYPSAAR